MELDSLFTAAGLSLDGSELNLRSNLDSSDPVYCLSDPGLNQAPIPSTDGGPKVTAADANNNESPPPAAKDSTPPKDDDNIDVSTIKARYKVEYNLRKSSLVNRVETEKRRHSPKEPKPKTRPPPLSKYRRRAANARERGRMLEINDAFDALAEAIPEYETEDGDSKGKPTKITTLRLALNYIAALRETLGYPSTASESGFSSAGEGCNSPSTSDSASEGLQSPARSNLDSEGETFVQ